MNLETICEEIMKSDAEILLVAVSYRADSHYVEREKSKSLHTKNDKPINCII